MVGGTQDFMELIDTLFQLAKLVFLGHPTGWV